MESVCKGYQETTLAGKELRNSRNVHVQLHSGAAVVDPEGFRRFAQPTHPLPSFFKYSMKMFIKLIQYSSCSTTH